MPADDSRVPVPLLAPEECLTTGEASGFGRLMTVPPGPPQRPLGLPADVARSIPEHLATRYQVIPLAEIGTRLLLGMVDPLNVIAIDDVRLITGFDIEAVYIPGALVEQVIRDGRCDSLAAHLRAIGRDDVVATMVPIDGARPTLEQRLSEGVPFPLSSLGVEARLSGPLASVKVTQEFHNPHRDFIEAVYVFPLPAGAAVHAFRMQVGDRFIEAEIQERRQASRTYEAGKQAGHRAAIIEQDRDNVFTVRLGNLPPGESVRIELEYAEHLPVDAARTTFRFPLVVAPRYIPGAPLDGRSSGHGTSPDTDAVADASRITPPLLFPGLRQPSALGITVHVETGGRIPALLACSQHAITAAGEGDGVTVSLTRDRDLLDRDFVLHVRLIDEVAAATLLAGPSHFLLSVWPPAVAQQGLPRDVIFLLDRSGSMRGVKMNSARQAVHRFLETLRDDDRFALLAFDDRVETWGGLGLHPATQRGGAARWLDGIEARDGTEMDEPLRQALSLYPPPGRLLCVILVTDGQVGDEARLCKIVTSSGSPARIFTLGIDTAVNDAFLRELARLGRGTCELVTPGEALTAALQRLSRETAGPLVTDLEIEDAGLGIEPSSHAPPADLFAMRPVHVLGRHQGEGGVSVRGRQRDGAWGVDLAPTPSGNPALPILWARAQVQALEDRLRLEPQRREAVEAEIVALALRHHLLTRFTSFVLVDRSETVNAGGVAQVAVQPVMVPAEWDGKAFSGFGPTDLCEVQDTMKDVSACDFLPLEEEIVLDKLRELVDEAPIVRVVNLILSQAIVDGATHVHVENHPKSITVRYRIDGVLHEVMNPPAHIRAPLGAQIRRMAEMESGQRRGRIQLRHDGVDWDIRVSACPTPHGERFVLRLCRVDAVPLSLEALGLADAEALRRLLGRGGWLLVSGPAREGGVRACLAALASEGKRNVMSVGGRPVAGAQAILLPTRRALEAVREQDVDALVVERVASRAVARQIVGAARRGCTVVAGVEAQDASAALWRVARWAGPDVVRGVLVGCRLRAVCGSCRRPSLAADAVVQAGTGCDACRMTGYRGTVAVFSLVEVSDELRGMRAAVDAAHPPGSRRVNLAGSEGDGGLRERAVARVGRGETTLEEVVRVLGPP